jgi:hypothetical protein
MVAVIWRFTSAVSTNVRGVDVESGALSARTRTPRAASLADRTAQRLVVAPIAHTARTTARTKRRAFSRPTRNR